MPGSRPHIKTPSPKASWLPGQPNTPSGPFTLSEQNIYGSSREGVIKQNKRLDTATIASTVIYNWIGDKQYQHANHLGNVLATVSDVPVADNGGSGSVTLRYKSDYLSGNAYSSFGAPLAENDWNWGTEYRYGFNGQEKDDELKGVGNAINFEYRLYDPRLGRWQSCDPMASKYPQLSPYNFVANNPLIAIDPDGRLIIYVNGFNIGADYETYWLGTGIVETFNEYHSDFSNMYASAHEDYILNVKAPAMRKLDGYVWASQHIDEILEEYHKTGQVILVSHSLGGAYAEGIYTYLEEHGITPTIHYAIAPHGDEAINAGDHNTYQFHNNSDAVSGFWDGGLYGDSDPKMKGSEVVRFKGEGGHGISDNGFNWIFSVLPNNGVPLNGETQKAYINEFDEQFTDIMLPEITVTPEGNQEENCD